MRLSGPCLGRKEAPGEEVILGHRGRLASPSRTQNPDVCPTGSSAGPPVTPCPGAGQTCQSHADPSLGVKFKLLTKVHKGLPGGQ